MSEWKIVPVEPTDEMLKAGLRWFTGFQHMRANDKRNAVGDAYTAMLAAAPAPAFGEVTEPEIIRQYLSKGDFARWMPMELCDAEEARQQGFETRDLIERPHYDALAQQLAASEAKYEAARDRTNSITLLKQQLAARDKRLEEAVGVIANTRRSLEKANESGAVIDTIWLDSPCSETLFDYLDAFLSQSDEAKEND